MSTDHTFAFVAGLHRSGTSLLFKCLRNHPDVSGFRNTGVPENEGQHLQTVYPPARVYGGPGRFGFDPRAHLTEQSDLVSDDSRDRLFSEWSRYWELSKRVLLEKSPPNLIRTRFLQAMFPNARFVIMQRHPVAVAYATQKWSRTPVASLIEHWLVCHELFEADRPRLKHVLVVRYEELVAAPQAVLDEICVFLDLPGHRFDADVQTGKNAVYLNRWEQSRDRFTTSGRLDATEICELYAHRVSRFNYDLVPLEPAKEAI